MPSTLVVPDTGTEVQDPTSGPPRIKCPRCGWSPQSYDHWACTCGHLWNTFDTGGVCPGCLKQWTDTMCPNCHQWSAHSDWYPHD